MTDTDYRMTSECPKCGQRVNLAVAFHGAAFTPHTNRSGERCAMGHYYVATAWKQTIADASAALRDLSAPLGKGGK